MKIMNSSEDVQPDVILDEEGAAGVFLAPDPNANVSAESKGAIPKKVKPVVAKKCSLAKQPTAIKLNNNIETMSTLNNEEAAPKLNGINGTGGNYLDELFEPSCSTIDSIYKFDLNKDDSSSDDNDLLSVSDDGCIYTYKGDHVADFPSSFFSLDIPPAQEVREPSPERAQTSSPEMDYLEMDFDPGLNGDCESNSENEAERPVEDSRVDNKLNVAAAVPETNGVVVETNSLPEVPVVPSTSVIKDIRTRSEVVKNSESNHNLNQNQKLAETIRRKIEITQKETEREMPWSCSLSQRTKSIKFRIMKRTHCTKGELVSPSENVPQIKGAKVSSPVESVAIVAPFEHVEPAMIWSRDEAFLKQVTQIGPSACGATAVLNVLNALRFPIPSIDKIKEVMNTRLRRTESPLTDYLISRSTAGTTHEDIIDSLHNISNGAIYARFFHMYPERVVNLYSWLGFWIKNGAIPVATLNLQRCLGTIPDAWHHQMIYGVDSNGIYLTNPLECVEAGLLWPQLCSESVLLVRRDDVLSRWNFKTDLPDLMQIKDIRWRRINVVGQVANMIHESGRELRPGFTNTSHIRIPASYSSGVTLAMTVNSPAFSLLQESPELPLLDPREGNSTYTYSYY